jgi:hypothetical protein
MARPGVELIESIVSRVSQTPEGLREAGFMKPETEATPRNVKSATTRYRNALQKDEGFVESERMRTEGQTKIVDKDIAERPAVQPEELEDSVLMGHKGDTTKTRSTVEEFEGAKLDEPVTTFGGAKFGAQSDNIANRIYWASMQDAATPFQNKAEVLQITQDMPVNAMYIALGKEGNYFNQAFADALYQRAVLNKKISPQAMDKFDADVRKSREDWVGIRSPDARSQLLGINKFPMKGAGKLRSVFVSKMNKAEYRDQGFPSNERLLQAFTEPDLLGAQLGDAGYSIGEVGADYGLSAIDTHPSYNTGIGGTYKGGLERSVPAEILFPDAWRKLGTELTKPAKGSKSKPRPLNNAEKIDAISKRKDLFQIADARWVDTVSTWLRNNPGKNNQDAIKAIGLPTAGLFLLDPVEAQAKAVEAVYAGTDRDLTDEEAMNITTYLRLQQAVQATEGMPTGMVVNSQDIRLDVEDIDPDPVFYNDDVSGTYLNAREQEQPSDLADFLNSQSFDAPPEKQGFNPYTDIPQAFGEISVPAVRGAGRALADFGRGVFMEGPKAVIGGFLDATAQVAEGMEKIIPLGTIGGDSIDYASEGLRLETRPDSVTGGFIRDMSQFMTGFLPATRMFKAAGMGNISSGMAGGAFADAFVFNPQEQRFSNIIQDTPLANPFNAYLAAGEDDSDLEGMFKNAVEGIFLGGSVEAIMGIARGIKKAKQIREVAQEEGVPVEQLINDAMANMKGGDPQVRVAEPAELDEGVEFLPFSEALDAAQAEIVIPAPTFKPGGTPAAPEDAQNINLGNLNTTEDVKTLIDQVAMADEVPINEARRQQITNDQLGELARDVGMDVQQLLARRQGEAFNAEQILASRKILTASGENLIKMAQAAKNGSEMDLVLFRRAMTQHRAIQAQVSGMTAEAGRALQQFSVAAKSAKEQERLIKEALETTGGEGLSRNMAAMIAELKDVGQVGKVVKEANQAKTFDVLYEVWINGLLSGPTTHMVNVISNSLTAAFTVAERKIASALGNSVAPDEASAQIKGMIEGAKDGLRLGWNALKSGEPSDQYNKLDVGQQNRALSAENLNQAGIPGRFADFLGEAVRVPGRLLTASDEFFKSVGYRMELQAQAYRTAFQEGLTDEKAALRIHEILENPPQNIKQAAIDAARYQTFTNSLKDTKIGGLGQAGQLAEKARAAESAFIRIPAKVILPFLRTPTNIASYTLERTPLAVLSSSVRNEIAEGGARRDLALAKITMGSFIMGSAADMTLSGQITGGGPENRDMKNLLRAKGWQPYSILINGKYYAYNRLDPIGAVIGLAADMTEIIGQLEEPDAQSMAIAGVIAVSQNMTSKTYLKGVTEFFDVMASIKAGEDVENIRAQNYLARMGSSLVPFTSAFSTVERIVDPELTLAFDYVDVVKSRLPGYNDDLPPRRNVFGEVITLSGGFGLDNMAGIYTSELKPDSVIDEIVNQKTGLPMPRRSIDGIELDVYQYDRLVKLMSGEAGVNLPLKQRFREMFQSADYQKLIREDAQNAIRSTYSDSLASARAQLINEDPSLKNAIEAQKEEEQSKRMNY